MKDTTDLIRGWIRKAESDLENARMCAQAGKALDTACFHAQQAAAKYLKAYLTAQNLAFPFVHNLEKLIEIFSERDPEFTTVKSLGADLTPFAVELRYDDEFWPDAATVRHALDAAIAIKEFILTRLPADSAERER